MKELVLDGLRRLYGLTKKQDFDSSGDYWQRRYLSGETSGSGSYSRLARFKATVLNEIVADRAVQTVIELGCGDGAQLEIARYPKYLGVDVSSAAVAFCKKKFAGDETKSFVVLDEFRDRQRTADLALSLDVIYHLVEDEVFAAHLRDLFAASTRYVAIYSSNSDKIFDPAPHVRHREFTRWIDRNQRDWSLVRTYKNPYPHRWWNRQNSSHCDLFLYERNAQS
jgi:methyltransferase family protein